jgi:hypothetical protein
MEYCTASANSSSPRGDSEIARHAVKISGEKRQQFMLMNVVEGEDVSMSWSGFSTMRSRYPSDPTKTAA